MNDPARDHARLLYALQQARAHLYQHRRDIVPREVYHALMTALGVQSLTRTVTVERGTGYHSTLERHMPDARGMCQGCATLSDVDMVPWPCPEVENVRRVLRELGWVG